MEDKITTEPFFFFFGNLFDVDVRFDFRSIDARHLERLFLLISSFWERENANMNGAVLTTSEEEFLDELLCQCSLMTIE